MLDIVHMRQTDGGIESEKRAICMICTVFFLVGLDGNSHWISGNGRRFMMVTTNYNYNRHGQIMYVCVRLFWILFNNNSKCSKWKWRLLLMFIFFYIIHVCVCVWFAWMAVAICAVRASLSNKTDRIVSAETKKNEKKKLHKLMCVLTFGRKVTSICDPYIYI